MIFKNFVGKNENEILEEIRKRPYCFSLLPPEWKENYNIIVESILLYPYNYTYIKEEYKHQRTLAIQAIVMSPYLFRSIPTELKNDMEISLLAIKNYPFNVKHLSTEMKNNQEIFFILVKENSWGLNYMSSDLRDDEIIFEKAISINPNVFGMLNSVMKKNHIFLKKILPKYNLMLQNFPEAARNDKDLIKIAIQNDYLNFYFLPKPFYNDYVFLFELYTLNTKLDIILKETKRECIIDKYNFYNHLLFYKYHEKEDNIFHMRELVEIIGSFLF